MLSKHELEALDSVAQLGLLGDGRLRGSFQAPVQGVLAGQEGEFGGRGDQLDAAEGGPGRRSGGGLGLVVVVLWNKKR